MQLKLDPKIILFFIILGITEIYMVGAFGSVEPSFGDPASEYRSNSRLLLLLTALSGLFLLPQGRSPSPVPFFPRLLYIPLLILLVWGLISILNAKSDQRMFEFIFRPVGERPWEWGPGTETLSTTKGLVWELFIVTLFIATVIKSTYSSAWIGILGSFVFCGVAVTLCGFLHQALDMPHIYGLETIRGREVILPDTAFPPFVYNANAAQFLNLAIALALGLAAYSHRSNPDSAFVYLWIACAGICVFGVVLAASKAGVLIMIAQLGGFLLWEGRYLYKAWKKRRERSLGLTMERKAALGAVGGLFAIFIIAAAPKVISRFGELIEHSQREEGSATMTGRAAMRAEMIDLMDPDKIGWRGSGPGSFAHFMPFIVDQEDQEIFTQLWHFAHCDPLQTIVEWGFLGAACWFFIGIGAVARAAWFGWNQEEGSSNSHAFKGLVIALTGVGLHSTYDFPLSVFSIHVVAMTCVTVAWTLRSSGHGRKGKLRRA